MRRTPVCAQTSPGPPDPGGGATGCGPGAELLAHIGFAFRRYTSYSEQSWTRYLPHFITHSRISSIMPRIYYPPSLVACTSQNPESKSTAGCVRTRHTLISSEDSNEWNLPVKILKVLGEGGFSFVYLAQDEVSGVSTSSCDYCKGHSH